MISNSVPSRGSACRRDRKGPGVSHPDHASYSTGTEQFVDGGIAQVYAVYSGEHGISDAEIRRMLKFGTFFDLEHKNFQTVTLGLRIGMLSSTSQNSRFLNKGSAKLRIVHR